MNHFETIINSKKERVPLVPNIFSFIGYDKFKYPFVTNYFVLQGYSCYVKHARHCYQVICVGWLPCLSDFPSSKFEQKGQFVAAEADTHLAAIDAFSEVVACLNFCYKFDFMSDDYTEYLMNDYEKIVYSNNTVEDAEKIIADKFGGKQLELF